MTCLNIQSCQSYNLMQKTFFFLTILTFTKALNYYFFYYSYCSSLKRICKSISESANILYVVDEFIRGHKSACMIINECCFKYFYVEMLKTVDFKRIKIYNVFQYSRDLVNASDLLKYSAEGKDCIGLFSHLHCT